VSLKLNFKNLADLDKGRLGKVLSKHVDTVRHDCINRPCDASGKAQKRTIVISLDFEPRAEVDDFGSVNVVDVACEATIESKLPKHRSNPVRMKINKTGLYFNPDRTGS